MTKKNPVKTKRLIAEACAGSHDGQIASAADWMPNVFVIGAPKCATTSLTAVFQRHPGFRVSRNLEPNFFGRRYARGWSWYKEQVGPGFGEGVYRCEASTMYSNSVKGYLHTPELINRCSPQAKIIYLVRNPIDRLVSQWRHLRGRNHLQVEEKYLTPEFSEVLSNKRLRKKIIGTSRYYTTIERYRRFFGPNQIYCMTFEDFTGNPREALAGLFDFFGVDPCMDQLLDSGDRLPFVNQAGTKRRVMVEQPEWPEGLKKKVLSEVKDEADAFLASIGKPSDYWSYS